MTTPNTYHHGNLYNTCIDNGIKILLEEGVEKLTLRNVAKKSNVSHNAPYRSFKDKEALLIAIAQRIYTELTAQIIEISLNPSENADADFKLMCTSFFNYAVSNPIKYQFISGNFVTNEGTYKNLSNLITNAYDTVKSFLQFYINNGTYKKIDIDKMAVLCISTIHGFCSIVIENKLDLIESRLPHYKSQLNFIIEQLLNTLKK